MNSKDIRGALLGWYGLKGKKGLRKQSWQQLGVFFFFSFPGSISEEEQRTPLIILEVYGSGANDER
jgi:hypothetical protein